MSTLYELTADYLVLLEMAEDPDVDEETLKDTLEGIEGEIEFKADGYAKVMQELDGKASTLKAEIDRLTARKKAVENNKDRIKKALEEAMKATGKTKFKTDLFSFGIQKNAPALKLADELDMDTIPAEFLTFPAPVIDKSAVKEALKLGKEFEWAHLEQGESLRIR